MVFILTQHLSHLLLLPVFASRHRAPSIAAQEVSRRLRTERTYLRPKHDLYSRKSDHRKVVAQEVVACKNRIQKVFSTTGALGEEDVRRAHSFLNILSVFETEIACQLKTWSRVLEVIEVKYAAAPASHLTLTSRTILR